MGGGENIPNKYSWYLDRGSIAAIPFGDRI